MSEVRSSLPSSPSSAGSPEARTWVPMEDNGQNQQPWSGLARYAKEGADGIRTGTGTL